MKLIFFGGGDEEDNYLLDKTLLTNIVNKRKPQMTFIPSSSYMSHLDFREFVNQYKRHKVQRFIHFPIDVDFTDVLKKEAFSSDIIHLSGGNTYYFLETLRRAKLLSELKSFVKSGGVLTGLSAGGIIMTNNIKTAGFPPFDRDENEDGVRNLKGLGLVNFEFFPHYRNSKRYDKYLLEHSKKIKAPIYASPDGAGIIVNNHEVIFSGKNYIFHKGEKVVVR
jgi:dipeptidase E